MPVTAKQSNGRTAMRPFSIDVPESDREDLRARIAATRWPEKETVEDPSQGVQLATMQALADYWLNEYDWRKCEAKLNSVPNFITEIDGLDIHFVHVRSKHENALPLVVCHGWPGSFIEQMKIVDGLFLGPARGGDARTEVLEVGLGDVDRERANRRLARRGFDLDGHVRPPSGTVVG